MINKFLNIFTMEELDVLSKFLIDVAKGVLGVPLVVYFLTGFSGTILVIGFVLDLILVILFLTVAFKLGRISKRRKHER